MRMRTLEWMDRVRASLCGNWFNHVVGEEVAARLKIAVDQDDNVGDFGGACSLEGSSSLKKTSEESDMELDYGRVFSFLFLLLSFNFCTQLFPIACYC